MESSVKPVVVIPVYKNLKDWHPSEVQSFSRGVSILKQHPIFLIGPNGMNWETLIQELNNRFGVQLAVEIFDDVYFKGIPGYNKLLKSSFFYRRFKKFTHLLIYQLDAYVFKDELIFWCKKEFDYIGAPWAEGFLDNSATNLIGVGNGGFSLRNVDSVLKALSKIGFGHVVLKFLERKNSYLFNSKVKRFIKYSILKRLLGVGDFSSFMKLDSTNPIYEDCFWGILVPSAFKSFSVASIEEAVRFSFEVNPRLLFEKNNNQLPFGCHAWLKYDPVFWEEIGL